MNQLAVVVELGVNGLGIIRSLGKENIPVIGIDSKRHNYGALSRFCRFVYCKDVNDYCLIETLLEIGRKFDKKAALFCSSDLTLLTVSKYREELRSFYSLSLPSDEVVKKFMSKKLFYKFAIEHNFSVPKTFYTNNREDVEKTGNSILTPCVIKPEIRDRFWFEQVPQEKVLFVKTRDDYFNLFKRYNIGDQPLVIQEWIDGDDNDVCFCLAYINEHFKPIAVFTGKKIRQYPVLTGVTACAESVRLPDIAAESLRFFKEAECVGICGVEFKFDRREKSYKITEPTIGRTDLQEAISTQSGINIPYIAYLNATGVEQELHSSFTEGIKWINEPYDLYSISQYFKSNKYKVSDLISSLRGRRTYALMNPRDPLPFLSFLWRVLKGRINR